MSCERVQRLVERAFVQQDAGVLRSTRDHLDACKSCRESYDRLFRGQVALAQRPDALPGELAPPEREMLRALVIAPPLRRRVASVRIAVAAVAGLGAVAAMLLLAIPWRQALEPDGPSRRSDEFLARGSGADAGGASAPLGIRVLCLSGTEPELQAAPIAANPPPGEPPRCRVGDAIGFATRNETDRAWHLQILVVAGSGEVLRAYPQGAGSEGIVAPGASDRPLDASMPLQRVGAGTITVYAVFSAAPLPSRPLLEAARERTLRRARPRGAHHVVRLRATVGR